MELLNSLKDHILKRLEEANSRSSEKSLTVGLEQEFFLFDHRNKPVKLHHSQEFLKALCESPNWRIHSWASGSLNNKIVTQVSHENQQHRYTAVKYEFPPFMLEVAFQYHANLNNLADSIFPIWNHLQNTAKKLGLNIFAAHKISNPPISEEIQRDVNPKLIHLAKSRRDLYRRRGQQINKSVVDFPAYIAGTQVHLGGTRWWEKDGFISTLYSLEPAAQLINLSVLAKPNKHPSEIKKERWEPYLEVFEGMKLLAFPDLDDWSFDVWISALLDSPLLGAPEVPSTELRPIDLSPGGSVENGEFFSRLRDLQLIRPRIFGTIEHRGDPAASTPEQMMHMAAIRLGQSLIAQATYKNPLPRTFQQSREAWLRGGFDDIQTITTAQEVFNHIHAELSRRNLQEERFLISVEKTFELIR